MNIIIRCLTTKDLTEAGFESMQSRVERLWICEFDQDIIDNETMNAWVCLIFKRLYAIFGSEIENEKVVVFISASEMDKPIILDVGTLYLLSQVGATIEFFSD
jgi:hypothetical protein